jgi:hypothetical protein
MNDEPHEWKDVNDVIYAVAKRASALANKTMDELRLMACSDIEGRLGSARAEFAGASKGELIEILLTEEFIEDISRTLEEV